MPPLFPCGSSRARRRPTPHPALCPLFPSRALQVRGQDWQSSKQQCPGFGWAGSRDVSKVVSRGGPWEACAGHHVPRIPSTQCDLALRKGPGPSPTHSASPSNRVQGPALGGDPGPLCTQAPSHPIPPAFATKAIPKCRLTPEGGLCMAHQDQRPQRAQWQKETFNNLGKGRKVGCKWGHEAGLRESCGGRKGDGPLPARPHDISRTAGGVGHRRPSPQHQSPRLAGGRGGVPPPSPELPGGQLGGAVPHCTPHGPHSGCRPNPRGPGAPGLIHPPSSGSHTHCRQQTWSWARRSCGSAPAGGTWHRPGAVSQGRRPRAAGLPCSHYQGATQACPTAPHP